MAGLRPSSDPSFNHGETQHSSVPAFPSEELPRTRTASVRSKHFGVVESTRQESAQVNPVYGTSWIQHEGQAPRNAGLVNSTSETQNSYLTPARTLRQAHRAQADPTHQRPEYDLMLNTPAPTWSRPEVQPFTASHPSGHESAVTEPMPWVGLATLQHHPRQWTAQTFTRQHAAFGLHSESAPMPSYPPSTSFGDLQRFRQFAQPPSSNEYLTRGHILQNDETRRRSDSEDVVHPAASRSLGWSAPPGPGLADERRYTVPSDPSPGDRRFPIPNRQNPQSVPTEDRPGFPLSSSALIAPRTSVERTAMPSSSRQPVDPAEQALRRTYVLQDTYQWPRDAQTNVVGESAYQGIDPDEEKFPCDKCKKRFRQKPDLARHKVSVHKAEGQLYECTYLPKADSKCQGIFKRRDNLRDHLRRKHRVEDKNELKFILDRGKIKGGTPDSRLSEAPSEIGQCSATG